MKDAGEESWETAGSTDNSDANENDAGIFDIIGAPLRAISSIIVNTCDDGYRGGI